MFLDWGNRRNGKKEGTGGSRGSGERKGTWGTGFFGEGAADSATVTINAEDELSVTISDGDGRTVASGMIAQNGTPITWQARLAVARRAGYNGF